MGIRSPSAVAKEIEFFKRVSERFDDYLKYQNWIDEADEAFPIGRAEIPSHRVRDKGVMQLTKAYIKVVREVEEELGYNSEDARLLAHLAEAELSLEEGPEKYSRPTEEDSIKYLADNGLYREWLATLFDAPEATYTHSVSYAGFAIELAIRSVIWAVSKTPRGWEVVGLPKESIDSVLAFAQHIYELDVYPTEQEYIGKALSTIPDLWETINKLLKRYSSAVRYEWKLREDKGQEWDQSPLPDDDLPLMMKEYRMQRAIAELRFGEGNSVKEVAKRNGVRYEDLLDEARKQRLVKQRKPRKKRSD